MYAVPSLVCSTLDTMAASSDSVTLASSSASFGSGGENSMLVWMAATRCG